MEFRVQHAAEFRKCRGIQNKYYINFRKEEIPVKIY
jgi:sRNA-binding regulator protein Hfq